MILKSLNFFIRRYNRLPTLPWPVLTTTACFLPPPEWAYPSGKTCMPGQATISSLPNTRQDCEESIQIFPSLSSINCAIFHHRSQPEWEVESAGSKRNDSIWWPSNRINLYSSSAPPDETFWILKKELVYGRFICIFKFMLLTDTVLVPNRPTLG